jgi:hypothetical protein
MVRCDCKCARTDLFGGSGLLHAASIFVDHTENGPFLHVAFGPHVFRLASGVAVFLVLEYLEATHGEIFGPKLASVKANSAQTTAAADRTVAFNVFFFNGSFSFRNGRRWLSHMRTRSLLSATNRSARFGTGGVRLPPFGVNISEFARKINSQRAESKMKLKNLQQLIESNGIFQLFIIFLFL